MKTLSRFASILLVVVFLSGCYHAKVTTGLTPSATVHDQPFTASWIYGLVPPKPVDGAAACPGGVAQVETRLSFVNQLVGFLTFGIYTPMHIRVTCATGGGASIERSATDALSVNRAADAQTISQTLEMAADQAVQRGEPVLIFFE